MDRQKLEIVRSSLEIAGAWEAKGTDSWRNVASAESCISTAIMNLLSVAVEEFANPSDATAWLLESGTLALLRRTLEQLLRLMSEVDAGRIPPSVYGGNYPHLVYVHLSWALREYSLGEAFVAISERKDIADISTPFWCEYAKGMASLVRRQSYTVPNLKLRGQEEYWVTYLNLIESVSSGGSSEEALQSINQAFAKRNSDRKIKDDSYETEGSGTHPVKWDYRRDSLMEYITQRRL